MARLPRLVLPAQPHYVIQRGGNRQPVFLDAADYTTFLSWLRTAAKTFKVALHAYVLMPEQLHLLVSPGSENALGQMMQWMGRYYVPYFNQKYGRAGALWQGRYKTSLIDPEYFFLVCTRYIELLPVINDLAPRALDYAWSSYAHHAGFRADPLITDHPLYWALGNTPFDREAAYLALTEAALPSEQVQMLEAAVFKGWPLGSDPFKQALEYRLKRQVMPAKRGRPFKIAATGGDIAE